MEVSIFSNTGDADARTQRWHGIFSSPTATVMSGKCMLAHMHFKACPVNQSTQGVRVASLCALKSPVTETVNSNGAATLC